MFHIPFPWSFTRYYLYTAKTSTVFIFFQNRFRVVDNSSRNGKTFHFTHSGIIMSGHRKEKDKKGDFTIWLLIFPRCFPVGLMQAAQLLFSHSGWTLCKAPDQESKLYPEHLYCTRNWLSCRTQVLNWYLAFDSYENGLVHEFMGTIFYFWPYL